MKPNYAAYTSEFWESVERASDHHALHSHRYFDRLFGADGDMRAVRLFQEQFFTFCKTFHQCLGGIISTTSNQAIIAMLSENLFDEMGRGDIAKSHLEYLKEFARSIGYAEQEIADIKPLIMTQDLNDRMIRVSRSDFFFGIGAVGLGAEFAGPRFFRNVYREFSRKPFLQSANLHIYEIHAGDDMRHRADMKGALGALNFSGVEESKMLAGIQLSHVLFHNFWEGVGEASGFYEAVPLPIPATLRRLTERSEGREAVFAPGAFMPSC